MGFVLKRGGNYSARLAIPKALRRTLSGNNATDLIDEDSAMEVV